MYSYPIYLVLVQISRRSYITYAYTELILITDLCSFGTPVGVTELILMQNLYLSYGVYTCSRVPVGIIEITERILDLLNLILYRSTCKYYGTYTDLTEHILVLQNLDMYFKSCTCLTELILILPLREYPWYYGTYTYVTETRVPLGTTELIQRQNLSYTGLIRYWTELIRIQELSDT